MTERIAAIQKMLVKTPDDVFLHYSLAKEFASAEQLEQAIEEFRKCIELDPKYLPAYVEGGKCLRSAGRMEESRQIFLSGKALAVDTGQRHTEDYIILQLETFPKQ